MQLCSDLFLLFLNLVNKSIRRKRKKRCNGKKSRPKSTGSQSSDTSTTSEVADINAVLPSGGSPGNQDGIFVMDDIENNEKVCESFICELCRVFLPPPT